MLGNIASSHRRQRPMALESDFSRRIIVANGSRLFRQLLQRALDLVPDLEVVSVAANLAHLSTLIERDKPHWLVVLLLPNGQMPEAIEYVIVTFPSLSVLGVAPDGSRVEARDARLSEQTTFVDISFEEMIRLLRAVPGRWIEPSQSIQ